jgi:hypothetical protein
VTRWPVVGQRMAAGALTMAAGCSNLTETGGGVVGLEIRTPRNPVVEVGQTIMLRAAALDAKGDSVPSAPIIWVTPDTTVILTPSGQLTGRTGGQTARVQAQLDTLVSDFVTFTVNPRPDTVVITGDSVLTVASDTTVSGPLLASLRSLNPAEPLADRVITYTVTAPVFADPSQRTVELPGGVLTLGATTGADGTPVTPVVVSRVAGRTAPDSSIVTVAAATATGAVVPGSGQRFIIHFQ